MTTAARLIRQPTLAVIRCYQATVSPDHGVLVAWAFPYGFCRYRPTCSEYSRQAVERYGVIRGLWMAARRVLRCNPWARGGEDPVR